MKTARNVEFKMTSKIMPKILSGATVLSVIWFGAHALSTMTSLPANYQGMTAAQKVDLLWNDKILPAEYKKLPDIPNPLINPINLLTVAGKNILEGGMNFLNITFDRSSDELPIGRTKLLHPAGSVGIVELVADSKSPFSGIYQSGGFGLARLSLAGNPDSLPFGIGSFTPGMAIKFLIDGRPSVNLHVMNSLDGQGGDHDFFARNFSNILATPSSTALKILSIPFSKVISPPTHLPVVHVASVTTTGALVAQESQISPYKLVFVPAGPSTPKESKNDFRKDLAKIPVDSPLYFVYGNRAQGENLQLIGTLVLRSRLVASQYGDEKLFFQHNKVK